MERYRNLSGRSGIAGYEISEHAIVVSFRGGGMYRYDSRNPGSQAVETMKRLALQGRGLATFINRNVRDDFAEKLD